MPQLDVVATGLYYKNENGVLPSDQRHCLVTVRIFQNNSTGNKQDYSVRCGKETQCVYARGDQNASPLSGSTYTCFAPTAAKVW